MQDHPAQSARLSKRLALTGPPGPEQAAAVPPVAAAIPPRARIVAMLGARPLLVLAGALLLVIALNTVAQVRLNAWHGAFYGAIEKRDVPDFVYQLKVFLVLAAILLCLVVSQTWLQEIAKVRLRERLTSDLLDRWLAPRRAFELNLLGGVGVNPDQRLQEDVRHLSELSVSLGAGFVQSALLLVTFTGVLWTLSTAVEITVLGQTFVIQGLMLWGTLLYSIAGSLLTYWVGAPLVRLHEERYAREAAFRFGLVKVAESAEEIAFLHGEAAERRTVDTLFGRVVTLSLSLARALANVTWVTSGYGWLAIIAPVVVASPAYFSGALTFGGLMMAVQAFLQVQSSLRWFVDNYPTIADWRATMRRVTEFRDAAEMAVPPGPGGQRISLAPHPEGKLAFERLSIHLPEGCAEFDEPSVVVEPGERVLIVGDAGAGKSTLVRAVAGLWTWGTGTIEVPPQGTVAYLTQKPYIPLGNLRDAITYPRAGENADPAALAAALTRVGLARLVDSLEEVRRWDRELSVDSQQRLAFARALYRRPRWVLLDEAASACAEEHRSSLLRILADDLKGTAIINVSRDPRTGGIFTRVLHLQRCTVSRHAPVPPPAETAGATA